MDTGAGPGRGGSESGRGDADRRFVAAVTEPTSAPFVPEVRLFLAADPIEVWEGTERHQGRTGLAPPFWAFAWAGGQALARHVLDHPELVRGRTVLDFAAGSGLVAVAAALAGARVVVANEIDPLATAAIALNAELNGVRVVPLLGDLIRSETRPGATDPGATDPTGWETALSAEVVLAGDVCYDRRMTALVLPFLDRARLRGAEVLVGDPGRAYLPRRGLAVLADYQVPVIRSLEDRDVRPTAVSRLVDEPELRL